VLGRRPRFDSDIKWLMKWRKSGIPRHLTVVDETDIQESDIPWMGLRNYWYPVMPVEHLIPKRQHRPTYCRLLGQDLALFYDADGRLSAVDAVCPHRGALLTIGWCDVYEPGTLTCRYHGWTFDATGKCVAALTDGPNSKIPNLVRIRSYPALMRYGAVWIYMGDGTPPPLEDSVPHLADVMRGRWPSVRILDWPVNYLTTLDNNADLIHPMTAHRTCARHCDAPDWDYPTVEELPCGGLGLGVEGAGPGPKGPRHNTSWEFHVPGYVLFRQLRGEKFAGSILFSVPIDIGNTRTVRLTSFGGSYLHALRDRLQNWWVVSRHGPRDNIYYCNEGPDAALLMSQGRLHRRDGERLSRSDKGVAAARRLIKAAYLRERSQLAAQDENRG
jgi:phenylpropionate dioxygenase-like ring-hydroxylating dioxygenase large terminal subunit